MTKNITNTEYHKEPDHISSTALKNFCTSPLHYKTAKFEETAALLFGSGVHDLIESTLKNDFTDFNNTYINLEQAEIDYFGNVYCESRNKKEYKEFKETISDKKILPASVWHIVKNMFRNGFIKWLLSGGIPELSIFQEVKLPFEDSIPHTIPIKVRPDYLNVDRGIIVDYKTLRNEPTEENCFRAITQLKYYISAGLYIMAAEKEYDKKFNFYFIFLEKEPPYDHNIVKMNRLEIERIFHIIYRLLNIYQKANYFEKYPGVRAYNNNKMQISEYVLPLHIKDDYHCNF